jgi:hypothetical protein
VADSVRDIAYEEALRNINSQAGVLSELRGRAGTLLGAASLVTSFLGGAALAGPTFERGVLTRPPIGDAGWVAIVSFCVIGAISLVILWPYVWRFDMSPVGIVTSAESQSVSAEDLKFDLTGFHQQNFESNQWKLDWLFWAFRLGSVALVVETIAWIVDLRG